MMITFLGVNGTCVARYASLITPTVFVMSDDAFLDTFRDHGYVFMTTTEEQKPLRDQFIKFGFSSDKCGDVYTHARETNNLPNPAHREIIEAIEAGEALSRAEGRRNLEIRAGDRVLYLGSTAVNKASLANAMNYWKKGQGVPVEQVSAEYVQKWGGGLNYVGNWYFSSFRRIPPIEVKGK